MDGELNNEELGAEEMQESSRVEKFVERRFRCTACRTSETSNSMRICVSCSEDGAEPTDPVDEGISMNLQLLALLHAHRCTKRGCQSALQYCETMKHALKHVNNCTSKWRCHFPQCFSSMVIIDHWKNCFDNRCLCCAPARRVFKDPPGSNKWRTVFDFYVAPKGTLVDSTSSVDALKLAVSSANAANNSATEPTKRVASLIDIGIEANNVLNEQSARNGTVRSVSTQALEPVEPSRSNGIVPVGCNSGLPLVIAHLYTTEKQKLIPRLLKQQMAVLVHAQKCTEAECRGPFCDLMKDVLHHRLTCSKDRECTHAHCYSSGRIVAHWTNCERKAECAVCAPLRRIAGDATGLPAEALMRFIVNLNVQRHLM